MDKKLNLKIATKLKEEIDEKIKIIRREMKKNEIDKLAFTKNKLDDVITMYENTERSKG